VARPGREPPHDAYRDAILAELDARGGDFAGRRLVSIYLGGGTPSLWRPDAIADVIAAVIARFGGPPDEVTLEANPTDCTAERLAAWRAAGVDRVSIGVQSVEPADLVTLGRDHRMGDGAAALDAALAAGLRSVSADLILGVPGSSTASLERLAATAVPHLSVYELTIEPRTALGRAAARGGFTPLSDERLADRYLEADRILGAAGFEHYEVSSYARPGHRAVHNGLYWNGGEYLGLGVGAASFRIEPDGGGLRETNVREAARYLRGAPGEALRSSAAELAIDRLWLGLRTVDGAALADLAAAGRAAIADRLISEGLCELAGERLRPTLRGFLFNDRIAKLLS
jgi:oxygen-independent coproporphyrinogen-3 oxidase